MSSGVVFDVCVIADGDLEAARAASVDYGLLLASAERDKPAFLGLELGREDARRVAAELETYGFRAVPVETEYRDRRMPDREVESAARALIATLIAKETKRAPNRKWGEPFLLEGYELDPHFASYGSVSWADDIEEDDLSVIVTVDRVDGHRVSDAEFRSRRHRWVDPTGVLEAVERLMAGDERTQLAAAEFLSRHISHPASLDALRVAEEKSRFRSVRARIGALLS